MKTRPGKRLSKVQMSVGCLGSTARPMKLPDVGQSVAMYWSCTAIALHVATSREVSETVEDLAPISTRMDITVSDSTCWVKAGA